MRYVLLGPPGAGKGTQAVDLAARAGVPHISTGDLLRRAIQQETPTGLEAKAYVSKGELVPFEVILKLVRDRLQEADCASGWILDGFPRNLEQAHAFATILGEIGSDLTAVIYFSVADEVVVSRLSGRRTCRACGAGCHIEFMPPKVAGVCDKCGGELYQRDDDNESSILNRLKVYASETDPLVAFYREQGTLIEVDGGHAVAQVTAGMFAALDMD